ncbi:MAG: hypothetical protein ACRYG5_01310 [Janthinobacterium lividum]
MAKGQVRSNREAKKPKQEKKVAPPVVASLGSGTAKAHQVSSSTKKKP